MTSRHWDLETPRVVGVVEALIGMRRSGTQLVPTQQARATAIVFQFPQRHNCKRCVKGTRTGGAPLIGEEQAKEYGCNESNDRRG